MLKKKLLLCFLVLNILLPLIFSGIAAAGFCKGGKDSFMADMIEKEFSEEESKGEENSFEKEKDKDFYLTCFNFFNFHSSLKKSYQILLNTKAISGSGDLYSPPPKNA
jgi:hypothetical protein